MAEELLLHGAIVPQPHLTSRAPTLYPTNS